MLYRYAYTTRSEHIHICGKIAVFSLCGYNPIKYTYRQQKAVKSPFFVILCRYTDKAVFVHADFRFSLYFFGFSRFQENPKIKKSRLQPFTKTGFFPTEKLFLGK